jgi:hypothetical protein
MDTDRAGAITAAQFAAGARDLALGVSDADAAAAFKVRPPRTRPPFVRTNRAHVARSHTPCEPGSHLAPCPRSRRPPAALLPPRGWSPRSPSRSFSKLLEAAGGGTTRTRTLPQQPPPPRPSRSCPPHAASCPSHAASCRQAMDAGEHGEVEFEEFLAAFKRPEVAASPLSSLRAAILVVERVFLARSRTPSSSSRRTSPSPPRSSPLPTALVWIR